MKAAVPTDNGQVAAHFGRCPEYTIAEINDGRVAGVQTIANPGHEPGFLPAYLAELGVHAVIASGMGPRAVGLFQERGITVHLGVSGPVHPALEAFARGELQTGESTCEHGSGGHGHCEHHGEGHDH